MFEIRRSAGLALRAALSAPPIRFEPTISCVTGRRALPAAPRGRSCVKFVSGSGGGRTHSILGAKPGWSASCLPSRVVHQCPEQESNLQTLGFKPSRSAVGVSGRKVNGPGWSRTIVSWMWAKRRRRWITGPGVSVDPPRVALGLPACDAGVFLLDHEPVLSREVRAGRISVSTSPRT